MFNLFKKGILDKEDDISALDKPSKECDRDVIIFGHKPYTISDKKLIKEIIYLQDNNLAKMGYEFRYGEKTYVFDRTSVTRHNRIAIIEEKKD